MCLHETDIGRCTQKHDVFRKKSVKDLLSPAVFVSLFSNSPLRSKSCHVNVFGFLVWNWEVQSLILLKLCVQSATYAHPCCRGGGRGLSTEHGLPDSSLCIRLLSGVREVIDTEPVSFLGCTYDIHSFVPFIFDYQFQPCALIRCLTVKTSRIDAMIHSAWLQ